MRTQYRSFPGTEAPSSFSIPHSSLRLCPFSLPFPLPLLIPPSGCRLAEQNLFRQSIAEKRNCKGKTIRKIKIGSLHRSPRSIRFACSLTNAYRNIKISGIKSLNPSISTIHIPYSYPTSHISHPISHIPYLTTQIPHPIFKRPPIVRSLFKNSTAKIQRFEVKAATCKAGICPETTV